MALTVLFLCFHGHAALGQYCQYPQFGPNSNPVTYKGGGYIVNPQIFDIFLEANTVPPNANWWTANSTGIAELANITSWGLVTNTYAFWNRIWEYGVSGSFNNPFSTSNYVVATALIEPPNANYVPVYTPSDANTRATIEYLLAEGSIPFSTNTIYMVYLSPNMACCTTNNGYSSNFFSGGYHASYHSATKNANVLYAVISDGSAENSGHNNVSVGSVSTHEIMEAVTDPYWRNWPNTTEINPNNASKSLGWVAGADQFDTRGNDLGNEIGDLCGSTDGTNNNSVTGGMAGVTVSQVWSQRACRCVLERDSHLDDFDGDGFEDTTLWQGRDYYQNPPPAKFVYWPSFYGGIVAQFLGINTDIPVVADYDGDWKADFALWYPGNLGGSTYFLVKNSSTGANSVYYVGSSSDDPVPADFDGDGLADPASWTPSSGMWSVLRSAYGHVLHNQQWGGIVNGVSDWPCPADFDGDGIADYTIYRPNDPARGPGLGQFYVLFSSTNYTTYQTFAIGGSSDTPCPTDVDGDGKADPMVYRPSDGNFYFLASNSNYLIQPGVYVGQYGSGLPMPRRWTFSNGALGSGLNDWSNAATFGVWDYWAAVWNWNVAPINSPSGGTSFRTGDSTNLTASTYYN